MPVILNIYAIIVMAALTSYGFLSFKRKEKDGKMLALSMWTGSFMFFLFTLSLYFKEISTKEMLYSIAYALLGWVFYFLLLTVAHLCGNNTKNVFFIILRLALILDSCILVTNSVSDFAVDFTEYSYFGVMLIKPAMGAFYITIGAVNYIIILSIAVLILNKTRKLSAYYRTQYYYILIGLLVVALVSLIPKTVGTGLPDNALCFLVIELLVTYYCAACFIPKSLLEKLQTFINDNMADASVVFDNEGNVLGVNTLAQKILDENTRTSVTKLKDFLDYPEPDRETNIEIGDKIFSVQYKPVHDEKNILIGEAFIFHDITEIERRIEREHKLAITDPLTGAYNRKGFFDISNEFLYRNEAQAGFALMISGILHFKSINSSYGAKTGDLVLKAIEGKFHEYHHSYPMIYGRTAEGKFTSLLPFDYVDEVASDMAEIRVPISNDASIQVELCHGFIVLDDVSKPLDYYYERALIALSECKKKATGGALEYSYDLEDRVSRKQVLLSEMHSAINEGQFFIELQPQINLSERCVCGAEALVRWKHPKLGRISPGEFIPLFEENGFISNLDVHVWEMAAKTLKMFEEEGSYNGPISVNVSQADIRAIDVAAVFERIVSEYGIDRRKLHIEITESACADKRESLVYLMEKLREKGFILEIDDFGSGYSSLNAIMHMPFDVVKLDMEFMKESNLEGKNGIIMDAIASMIHNIGASIIVEGVETEKNVENMVKFGGDVAQGYYFSRPLSIDAFREYAINHTKK